VRQVIAAIRDHQQTQLAQPVVRGQPLDAALDKHVVAPGQIAMVRRVPGFKIQHRTVKHREQFLPAGFA